MSSEPTSPAPARSPLTGRPLEQVRAFLEEQGWSVEPSDDDVRALTTTVRTANGSWPFVVWMPEDDGPIVCYSLLVDSTPEPFRDDLAAMLAEVNFGLLIGSFEIDDDDGEVRFRTSLGVRDVELTRPLLSQLVFPNIAGADDHVVALRQLAGGARPISPG